MSRIRGRMDDLIIMGAVKVFPSQIEQVILDVEGLEPHYEIVVDRAGGADWLEIRVEGDSPAMGEKIERRLASLLDVPAKVTLVERRTLARSEGGKARRVVDKRTA